MATKFTPWLGDNVSADNCLTNDEYQSNGDRLYGFKPNDVASSKNVNSGLRLATLVASALMSMIDDAGTYDLTSSVTDISGAIEYYFDNRQYFVGDTIYRFSNRTMSSDHGNVLNDNYCFAIGCGNKLTNGNASSTTGYGIAAAIGNDNNIRNSNAAAKYQAIAIGSNNEINNNNAIVVGNNNNADCMAFGTGLENSTNSNCLVLGRYNDSSDCLRSSFIIGGGTSSSDRKNVLTIDNNLGNENVVSIFETLNCKTDELENVNTVLDPQYNIRSKGLYVYHYSISESTQPFEGTGLIFISNLNESVCGTTSNIYYDSTTKRLKDKSSTKILSSVRCIMTFNV